MFTPPDAIVPILQPFSTLFQQRTWLKAQVLLVGLSQPSLLRASERSHRAPCHGTQRRHRLRKAPPRPQPRRLLSSSTKPSSTVASDSTSRPRRRTPGARHRRDSGAEVEQTFVDAIALARRHMWLASETFRLPLSEPDIQKVPTLLFNRLMESLTSVA